MYVCVPAMSLQAGRQAGSSLPVAAAACKCRKEHSSCAKPTVCECEREREVVGERDRGQFNARQLGLKGSWATMEPNRAAPKLFAASAYDVIKKGGLASFGTVSVCVSAHCECIQKFTNVSVSEQ